jgi:hypothetical protein
VTGQTPDEWLLAEYDTRARDPIRRGVYVARPIFSLIDDHEADPDKCALCHPQHQTPHRRIA